MERIRSPNPDFRNFGKISVFHIKFIFQIYKRKKIWLSSVFLGPPNVNQTSNQPKNGAKMTGMDIGEFTYIAYEKLLSALYCVTAMFLKVWWNPDYNTPKIK